LNSIALQIVPYHIVKTSPLPFILSCNLNGIAIGIALSFSSANPSLTLSYILHLSLLSLIECITIWLLDITVEATFLGNHTYKVVNGINLAFILFILSEIALFGSIFWGYLNSGISPSLQIGSLWPPISIEAVTPFVIPLIGSALLFSSSLSLTVSHYALIGRLRNLAINYHILTLFKGIYFTTYQLYEYYITPFTLSDSIFGSIFYIATGLHGSHILFGSLFLLVSLFITLAYFNTDRTHTGYKLTIIYWHFVDVLWAFIYAFIYVWPAIILNSNFAY
jgi:cytochrome c oxidase subunit 3